MGRSKALKNLPECLHQFPGDWWGGTRRTWSKQAVLLPEASANNGSYKNLFFFFSPCHNVVFNPDSLPSRCETAESTGKANAERHNISPAWNPAIQPSRWRLGLSDAFGKRVLFPAVSFSSTTYFQWERGHFYCLITACAAFYSEPEIHSFHRQRSETHRCSDCTAGLTPSPGVDFTPVAVNTHCKMFVSHIILSPVTGFIQRSLEVKSLAEINRTWVSTAQMSYRNPLPDLNLPTSVKWYRSAWRCHFPLDTVHSAHPFWNM